MRRAGLAALVMLAVAIVAGIIFFTKDLVRTKDTSGKVTYKVGERPEKDRLFSFGSQDIRSVDVTVREVSYNQTTPSAQPVKERELALAREGEQWVLTKPLHALAATGEADGLATAVADLRVRASFTDLDPNDPQYGLRDPCVIARVTTKRGKKYELRIGKDTAVESNVYLWLGGKTVYYAASSVKTSLIKQPKDLREKKVADFDTSKVKRAIIDHNNVRMVCEQEGKKDKKEWWLTQPVRAQADNYAVDDVVTAIKDIEAKEFVDNAKALSEYGFGNPQLVARIDFGKGKDDVVVTFGKQTKQSITTDTSGTPSSSTTSTTELKDLVYCTAQGRDEVFLVEANVIGKIAKKPIDLRDKNVVDYNVSDVQSVSVVRKAGANFEAVKKDAKWSITKPVAAEASTSKVEDFLWDFKDIKAEDFLDEKEVSLAEAGLVDPQASVTLTIKDKGQPLVISFGRQEPNGTRYYLRTSAMSKPVLVNQSALDSFPKSVEDLKEKPASLSTTTPPATGSTPPTTLTPTPATKAPPMKAPPPPAKAGR